MIRTNCTCTSILHVPKFGRQTSRGGGEFFELRDLKNYPALGFRILRSLYTTDPSPLYGSAIVGCFMAGYDPGTIINRKYFFNKNFSSSHLANSVLTPPT